MISLRKCLRLRDVKRFHIVNTSRQQTVAEHSFVVAVIALDLFNHIVGIDPHNEDNSVAAAFGVLAGALYHDHEESETGDIPSPIKGAPHTPHFFLPYGVGKYQHLHPEYARFVEMADKIEAAVWAHEHVVGNKRPEVTADCWARLDALVARFDTEQPEADWPAAVNRVLEALDMDAAQQEHWMPSSCAGPF